MNQVTTLLSDTIRTLSDISSYSNLYHSHKDGEPLPSVAMLQQIVTLVREIIFPGYYGTPVVNSITIQHHIGVKIETLQSLLVEQILAGLCYRNSSCEKCQCNESNRNLSREKALQFIAYLPELRRVMSTDVIAAYNGDPAAESYEEIIFCYPAIRAICNYRIAHHLLTLGVPLIPRIITELAHSETGIDIHPGASIGEYFTIDHGTGVVIGQTAIIGNNVKLYQGVTLGAKSFPLDEQGNPIKGIMRHPILEDNVVIYSNATILGRITIGEGASIGGNIWVTKDVPKGAKVVQNRSKEVAVITDNNND